MLAHIMKVTETRKRVDQKASCHLKQATNCVKFSFDRHSLSSTLSQIKAAKQTRNSHKIVKLKEEKLINPELVLGFLLVGKSMIK